MSWDLGLRLILLSAAAGLGFGARVWAGEPAGEVPTATVIIRDFVYLPEQVDVTVGQAVTWINEDGALHTASDARGEFSTGRLAKDQAATIVFDRAGTYLYACVLHANMGGAVIVRAADGSAQPIPPATSEELPAEAPPEGLPAEAPLEGPPF